MKLIKYIILGIIQGFTEPLPVSSSGHIFIFKYLFNSDISNDLSFEIIVNAGSLLAVCLIYRKRLVNLLYGFIIYLKDKNIRYKRSFKYSLYILVGCIPAGIIGFLLKDYIESVISMSFTIVGISFIITSIFLYLVRNIDNFRKELTFNDALYIGIVQTIALLPGISRSGSTLIAGLLCGLSKEESFDYSFMLYIPISFGTTILGIKDLINNDIEFLPYFLGFIFSFVVSFFTLKWFRNIVRNGKLIYFSIYCLLMGLFVLIFM